MNDRDIVELRHLMTDAFLVSWNKGMKAYLKGEWVEAREIFHGTVCMLPNGIPDGPSKFLISIIDEYDGSLPNDWMGYRKLGEGAH
jgi:hypothetical protein